MATELRPRRAEAWERPREAPRTPWTRQHTVLAVLGVAAVASIAGFLLVDITGSWAFALELRARKIAAMVLVGYAIAVSTVLFQTVTNNRILTPSIMGFDSLYVLIQSVSFFFFGAVRVVQTPPEVRFAIESAALVLFAGLLHRWLFRRGTRDLYVLVLAGIVFGTLFGSGSDLVNRLIDPNEFQTLQDRLFASFNSVNEHLLGISAVTVALASVVPWRFRRELDVVALGREHALNLGVDHHRVVNRQLAVIAVMVAVPTALVGPITFFGLLVANLARQMLGSFSHRVTLPAAVLLGILALVGGQFVLERLLGYTTALSVVVNLIGGVYFLLLLLREGRR